MEYRLKITAVLVPLDSIGENDPKKTIIELQRVVALVNIPSVINQIDKIGT